MDHVITKNGRATGVMLEDGTELEAKTVVSAVDPRRTFMELVDPRELPTDLVDNIRRFKFQGTSAKVNFALDANPTYPALAGRSDQYRGFINIGPSLDYLERAFDDAKYGWYSQKPYIDGCIQSNVDPDMAPPGKAVMSCFIQYAPYHLKESDWDTEKQKFGDTVQATLERFFPGFGDLVLHREVVTPLDIERTVGLTEGNIFAGEFLAPQMFFFRPAPGWNQYRTPIEGYYQCGSGTHPGGCVMGAPGRFASQQIIGDLARRRSRNRGRSPTVDSFAVGSAPHDVTTQADRDGRALLVIVGLHPAPGHPNTSAPLAPPDTLSPPTTTRPPPTTTLDIEQPSIVRVDPTNLEPLAGYEPMPMGDWGDWYWSDTSDNGRWLAITVGDEPNGSSELRLVDLEAWEVAETWSVRMGGPLARRR